MERLIKILGGNDNVTRFIREYKPQIRKIGIVAVLIIAGILVYNIGDNRDVNTVVSDEGTQTSSTETVLTIFVDIGGAVNKPMLAELKQGSRVEDAIEAAGGLKENADISSINRAEILEDGQKIFIPEISESDSSIGVASDGKVNINTADSQTLQTLNGVGPATAKKIIDYREKEGRFSKPEELKNVSGIGDKTFEKLEDYITI